ncbi:MAG: DUF2829 domain-containing protein [Victivallales bacterium]|nr:DUF2829 domain-containing protein [Bacteroidales bacterium]MBQ9446850.1 DUF2829 domain-containing protein [Victivallales bacterium]
MIFGIDFDGTIVENAWPEIGTPKQTVVDYIKQLQNIGHKWILITCRHDDYLNEALKWLEENNLYPDAVNDNLPEKIAEFNSNPRKVQADVYIDDHNAGGLCLPSLTCYGKDFSWALRTMRVDGYVTRRAWTWKWPGRFIYMVSGKAAEDLHFRCFTGCGSMVTTWMPTNEDMLTDDWYEINPD